MWGASKALKALDAYAESCKRLNGEDEHEEEQAEESSCARVYVRNVPHRPQIPHRPQS